MVRNRLNNTRGFTFIELAVCLTILAIVAAIGAARFREPAASVAVHDTAHTLMGDIRMVQNYAMNGSAATASITIAANSYQVTVPDGKGGTTTRTVLIDKGVSLTAKDSNGNATNIITFTSSGSPGLHCAAQVTVSKNGNTRSVTILATTGKTQLQ